MHELMAICDIILYHTQLFRRFMHALMAIYENIFGIYYSTLIPYKNNIINIRFLHALMAIYESRFGIIL